MKAPNYFYLIAIVAISSLFFSCKKDSQALTENSTDLVGKTADYSDPISQQRVDLAKTLMEAFKTNPEMATQTISSCNEKFDGDRNVLCSTLFSQTVSTLNDQTLKTNGTKTFGTVLNELASTEGINKTAENFSEKLLQSDSLIQLYLFVSNPADTIDFEGVIIIPVSFDEITPVDLLLVKKDGSKSLVRSDVVPLKNYLIISRNERSSELFDSENVGQTDSSSTFKTQATRVTKITRASFTSYSGLRSCESWVYGEPEVRVTMIYTDGGVAQMATAMWPGKWLGGTQVKWNYMLINLPLWNTATQSMDRKFHWTEQDGYKSLESEINVQSVLEGGQTISTVIKIPATESDRVIGSSYLNYNDMGVLQTYGIIKFDVN